MRNIVVLSLGLTLLWLRVAGANEKLVIFGDSISDNGNSFFLSQGTQPPPPYGNTYNGSGKTFPGRWTDGRNWVDYLSFFAPNFPPVTPFFADPTNGTNVAIGGSTTADLLNLQIPQYLASKPANLISGEDLYVIWIGANDFAAEIKPTQTVTNIRDGIATLAAQGARNFVVINIPDLSLTPDVREMGGATILAAKRFVFTANVLLEVELLRFALQRRISIDLVDINSIVFPLVFNPGRFGFTNSTGAAFNPDLPESSSKPVSNPDSYVFWDGFHPTTKVHRIAAAFIVNSALLKRHFHGFLSFR